MTMAGLVIKDKFIVGVRAVRRIRGWVSAYDLNSGKQVGKLQHGPDEDIKLAPDFNQANPHYCRFGEGTRRGRGERWGTVAAARGVGTRTIRTSTCLYYSTGNPGTWNPTPRQGDNKWSVSIFARDPDTGMAKWAYQMTPWDAWDYDVSTSTCWSTSRWRKAVKALVHFDRNGFAMCWNRTNEPFSRLKNSWRPPIGPEHRSEDRSSVEDPTKRTKQGVDTKQICPSAMGGKNQQPVSFSPRTGLFYVGTNNLCMNYEGTEVQYIAGAPYVGANVRIFPGPGGFQGEFMAWDPVAGKKVWGITEPYPVWSGTLVTASDVVFYGTMDGWFKAVNAKSGAPLWKGRLPSGSIGNPMTFVGPDKKQYVAIYSGVRRWFGLPIAGNLSRQIRSARWDGWCGVRVPCSIRQPLSEGAARPSLE